MDVAAFATVIFVCCYSVMAKWWKNPIGRSLVFMDLAFLGALVPNVLVQLWPKHLTAWVMGVGGLTYLATDAVVLAVLVTTRIFVFQRIHGGGVARDTASTSADS